MTVTRAIAPLLLLVAMVSSMLATGSPLASAATQTGTIAINVTLESGPEAAARTWRFEVLNVSGLVVETLSAGTSGGRLSETLSTGAIPQGFYTVRQVLTGDTKANCAGGAFYEVTAPVGASTVVELAGPAVVVQFTIRPCAALPRSLAVNIPVDTIAPGVLGDAAVLPEPPIDEVLGVRSAGPVAPLPPATGTSVASPRGASSQLQLLLGLGGALVTILPGAAAYTAIRRSSSR